MAYRFGSMFLSESSPRGAGHPDLAMQLLERGIQANPDYWRFYEDLGFIYYFDLKDYAKASEAFAEGSKNPDAQIWMKMMAAKIAAEGESFETSIFLWRTVYESAKDPTGERKLRLRICNCFEATEDCKQLDALADEFAKKNGTRARRA